MFKIVKQDFTWEYTKREDWYLKNTWSDEQQIEFKNWLVDYLYNNLEARKEIMNVPIRNKKTIISVVDWFLLDYGWTTIPQKDNFIKRIGQYIIRITKQTVDRIMPKAGNFV